MKTFSLKTFVPGKENSQPHFFILNRGLNSGKPLRKPCPNCFVLTTQSEEEKEQLFWLIYGLWQTKAFHFYLRGSVIPFITISELQKCIRLAAGKALENSVKFTKAVDTLQKLNQLEQVYKKNMELINISRKSLFYRYFP